jgi:hypothetical protein
LLLNDFLFNACLKGGGHLNILRNLLLRLNIVLAIVIAIIGIKDTMDLFLAAALVIPTTMPSGLLLKK